MAHEELQAAQAQLKTTQANLKATEAALGAARSKHNRYKSVTTKGALSRDQLEEAELVARQQEQAVKAQEATVEVQKQTIDGYNKLYLLPLLKDNAPKLPSIRVMQR